jgi:glycosyltransferase involved in cell wall biosynthesis
MDELKLNNKVLDAPLVSIITVVFNGKKYFEQTIKSVIEQSYKNIEYIVIDGGSTDGTLDIIEQYKHHISQWISEPDDGLYDAMNKGIGLANGELIGMINSDDWYQLDAVKKMVDAYLMHPDKTIFHADRIDIDSEGGKKVRQFNPSALKLKYYGMTYNHPSMFISKHEYKEHLYNTQLNSLSDYQFILEAFLDHPDKIFYLETPVVNYRLAGISAQTSKWQSAKEAFEARKNAGMNIIQRTAAFMFSSLVRLFYYLK